MTDSDSPSNTAPRLLLLAAGDNVCVVTSALEAGERVEFQGQALDVAAPIPTGHKIAVRAIGAGEKVIKYGHPIGSATCPIAPGEHVHIHNLTSDYLPTFTRGGEGSFLERR